MSKIYGSPLWLSGGAACGESDAGEPGRERPADRYSGGVAGGRACG